MRRTVWSDVFIWPDLVCTCYTYNDFLGWHLLHVYFECVEFRFRLNLHRELVHNLKFWMVVWIIHGIFFCLSLLLILFIWILRKVHVGYFVAIRNISTGFAFAGRTDFDDFIVFAKVNLYWLYAGTVSTLNYNAARQFFYMHNFHNRSIGFSLILFGWCDQRARRISLRIACG